MNQQRYTAILKSLDVGRDPYFLPRFSLQMVFLAGSVGVLYWRFSDSGVRFLAIPLIAIFMFRSFAFMHEAVHGLISTNKNSNYFFGVLYGTFCLLSYESWRQAHLEHHRWSGNLDKDPVMAMVKIFPTFPKPLRALLTFGWNCWLPTLSFLQHTVFWSITVQYTFKGSSTAKNLFSVVFPLLFWVGFLLILPTSFIFTILMPSLFIYLIGTEVINAPHHLGLSYFRDETKIPFWAQFKTARSCVYPDWLAKFVVLNFNFHSEHHMYPFVPWYHLDKIHRIVSKELEGEFNLDPKFSWVLKNRSKDLATVFGSSQIGRNDKNDNINKVA